MTLPQYKSPNKSGLLLYLQFTTKENIMEVLNIDLDSMHLSGGGTRYNAEFPRDSEWHSLNNAKSILFSDFIASEHLTQFHLIFNNQKLSINIHSNCKIDIPEGSDKFKLKLMEVSPTMTVKATLTIM